VVCVGLDFIQKKLPLKYICNSVKKWQNKADDFNAIRFFYVLVCKEFLLLFFQAAGILNFEF